MIPIFISAFAVKLLGEKCVLSRFYHVTFLSVTFSCIQSSTNIHLEGFTRTLLFFVCFRKGFDISCCASFCLRCFEGSKVVCLAKRSILIWIEYKWKIAAMQWCGNRGATWTSRSTTGARITYWRFWSEEANSQETAEFDVLVLLSVILVPCFFDPVNCPTFRESQFCLELLKVSDNFLENLPVILQTFL